MGGAYSANVTMSYKHKHDDLLPRWVSLPILSKCQSIIPLAIIRSLSIEATHSPASSNQCDKFLGLFFINISLTAVSLIFLLQLATTLLNKCCRVPIYLLCFCSPINYKLSDIRELGIHISNKFLIRVIEVS